MFSGRFLLSLSALAFGGMSAWTSVSLKILSPIDLGGLGPFELLLYGRHIAMPVGGCRPLHQKRTSERPIGLTQ